MALRSPTHPLPTITEAVRVERAAHVDYVLATQRMEGIEPTIAEEALLQGYIDGQLSLDEFSDRMENLPLE